MKIYTKTGDKGQTSLFTGKRVPKNDLFIKALGDVELKLNRLLKSFLKTPNFSVFVIFALFMFKKS